MVNFLYSSPYMYVSQAVEKLNITPKHFRDLLTDEPFKRTDIIDIQVGRVEEGREGLVYPPVQYM